MTNVLQNVIFPTYRDPDLLPLYADPETWSKVNGTSVRQTESASIDNIVSRSSAIVRVGRRVSYGTYFNAFPASYWQRWTTVEKVTLTLKTSGTGTVIVYKSNSSGAPQQVYAQAVDGEKQTHEFLLPLDSFSDGGWYWFDLIAGKTDLTLVEGFWHTKTEHVQPGKLNIGMTTFNKPDYCVETLKNIAADKVLLDQLDQIFLVDQGTKKVHDETGFAAVAEKLGTKLRVINQPNLGGSGGFSRAMAETLKRAESEFLLLLDDDIQFETESALRALQFGRFNHDPMIIGGHMFDLYNKSIMHAWAEVVNPHTFMWGPSFKEQHRHDFKNSNLRQTPWMHARLDADYNGWWMCMIPKKVIAEIGLSIPAFIKWDDAEYGLRAKAAGYRTVSLPGVALWHVSWLDKDDSQDWQAFFHTRNRIIAGLLHSDAKKSGGLLQNSGRQDIKKLLNMQYYATQLAVDGMREVLRGPKFLHKEMLSSMPNARQKTKNFLETRLYLPDDADVPVSKNGRALPSLIADPQGPTGLKLALFTIKNVVKHWVRSSHEEEERQPEFEYPKREAFWWVIPKHESVLVGTADGKGKMWYRHDQKKFRKLLKQSIKYNRKIVKNWDRLAKKYRQELPKITSVQEWEKTFARKEN